MSDESGRPHGWSGIELKQPTLTDLKSGEPVRDVRDVRVFPLLHLLMEHVKNTELFELIHIIMKELENLDNLDNLDKNNKEDTPPLDSSPSLVPSVPWWRS